jgi:hypothetical protein
VFSHSFWVICVLASQSFMQSATHFVPWARICAGVSLALGSGAVLAFGPVGSKASLLGDASNSAFDGASNPVLGVASNSAWTTPEAKTRNSEQAESSVRMGQPPRPQMLEIITAQCTVTNRENYWTSIADNSDGLFTFLFADADRTVSPAHTRPLR